MHHLFELNLSYSSINTARSALSIMFWNDTGVTVGSQPIIKRYMKGVFEWRPPKPRYTHTWDASIMLNYLLELFPNEELSLLEITHKTVCLFALASAQRAQTLSLLSTNELVIDQEKCYIRLLGNVKTSGPKNVVNKIELTRFSDIKLCPVAALEQYLKITKSFRTCGNKLFISPYKPYNGVSAESIGRWIKFTMNEAGLDIGMFKAHSIRSATSSAADRNGVNVQQILKTAGWKNADTFMKYYKKPVLASGFSQEDLGFLV